MIEYYSRRNDYEHIIALRDDNIVDLYDKYTQKAKEAAKLQAKFKSFLQEALKMNMSSLEKIDEQTVKKQKILQRLIKYI